MDGGVGKGLSKQNSNSDIEEAPLCQADITYGGTGIKTQSVWR